MDSVFSDIYRHNRWNGAESLSGPGSGAVPTARIAPAIANLVFRLNVQSVLDVGCGDSFWLPDLPGYLGVDVAQEAIDRARKFHPERDYQRIGPGWPLPIKNLVLCRDVIQHQSIADALTILQTIRDSGSTWLLASTFRDGEVVEIETGEAAWRPDLTLPMFGLGEPSEVIQDGYDWTDPEKVRDPGKLLGLWRLR